MIDWYKKVVFGNYANFNGRARRSEYWYFALMNGIVMLFFLLVAIILFITNNPEAGIIFLILCGIYVFLIIIPGLAVTVRRLHDIGKSGLYYFVRLIPIVGSIWLLVLLLTDSDYGTNQWGPNPKDAAADDINEIGTIKQF
jgi:uncharacterized membrane protein YhaH (DUF805 family)